MADSKVITTNLVFKILNEEPPYKPQVYNPSMSIIASVEGVVGEHRYSQQEITEIFSRIVSPEGDHREAIKRIHEATKVNFRSLALTAAAYEERRSFGESNDVFIDIALKLGAKVINTALESARIRSDEVDLIVATSITGIATPSLETRLVPILGFREDIKRIPIFGLGCAGGAAGIARVHDYLIGHPDEIAILLSVELCSLTLQSDDLSMANIVSSGLFGDGAGAIVMVGSKRAERMKISGPRVVNTRSRVYPNTEDAMGWDIGSSGFRIFLSPVVSDVIAEYLGEEIEGFLNSNQLTTSDIARWVCHAGGPKILRALESTLDLNNNELAVSWNSLADKGNLSSSAVIHILSDVMQGGGVTKPIPGTSGLLLAMGPGFSTELVLLEW